ncbi:MAG: glycosyltransferase [Polyangiaceae bacterium]
MKLADRVTVSVLTHDRAESLENTLRHLLAAAEDAPILVVDNGSTDKTEEVIARFSPRVGHVRLHENHGAAGRNAGILAANTPFVALCDDDTWWERGSLARAVEALETYPRLAVVTARIQVGPEGREDPTNAIMAKSPLAARADLPGPSLLGFMAGASMVRRAAFLHVGGFDPRFFLGGEEILVAVDLARAGWTMSYLPTATVRHLPSPARDVEGRRFLLARNALWFHWLRRPLKVALHRTADVLKRAPEDPAVRRALMSAIRGLPWVLRERLPVPEDIESDLCKLAL